MALSTIIAASSIITEAAPLPGSTISSSSD
jgi:hypothetical protein